MARVAPLRGGLLGWDQHCICPFQTFGRALEIQGYKKHLRASRYSERTDLPLRARASAVRNQDTAN